MEVGGGGIGAKTMFRPDPVVPLVIERVLDQMPLAPTAHDHHGHALGRTLGEVGDIGVESGGLRGDFPGQDEVGLAFAPDNVLDPTKVLQALLASVSQEMADAVSPVEGKQSQRLVPSGWLSAFFESQSVAPAELVAQFHNQMAGVKPVGHQADGQFGGFLFEASTQSLEALGFAVLLLSFKIGRAHV